MGPGARTSDGLGGGRLLFQTCWDEQVPWWVGRGGERVMI